MAPQNPCDWSTTRGTGTENKCWEILEVQQWTPKGGIQAVLGGAEFPCGQPPMEITSGMSYVLITGREPTNRPSVGGHPSPWRVRASLVLSCSFRGEHTPSRSSEEKQIFSSSFAFREAYFTRTLLHSRAQPPCEGGMILHVRKQNISLAFLRVGRAGARASEGGVEQQQYQVVPNTGLGQPSVGLQDVRGN